MADDPKAVTEARMQLGARLAALRAAAGFTQGTFAPKTYYGRSSIANIETGRQTAPRTFWALCDTVLDTGGTLTSEHDRIARLRITHHINQPAPAPGPVVVPGSEIPFHPDAQDLMMQIAAVAAASGMLAGSATAGRRRIAITDVVRLAAVADLYRSVDREWGGGILTAQLAQLAEAATAWLDPGRAAVDAAARPRLASTVADVRMLVGWTAFDAGQYEDSQRHFVLAERAAVSAADPLLTARIRYCQARQFQHRHHNIDALHTLQFAREALGTAATPAVLTMLLGAEAASLAALGQTEAALRCLDQASDTFARVIGEREPTWMSFYDIGELRAQYGRVYRDLARQQRAEQRPNVPVRDPGHGADAVRWVREALAGFDSGNIRSIVLNQVGLCSALLLADDPDQALSTGADLLTKAARVSSRRVWERIHNLRRDFGPHHRRADVAAFGHMLTTGQVST
ncbi:tetratricopeptide (TPR) repeat protein [Allocatelliglobosispora scoriae]|uniref:Tetratricopeptide (TPR) repeat protein n=1 Tax=Allocatelliglobosispora scoriae TaxID=643052 RepID=A0A841BHA6_9ACTN|nr:helix-turn-helix domain-containing protein [Allocatelliglobosispora scoriae]MBB5866698.1 tetratricopeptide (TPR) repeat protein [Allocatelliglobosispora scoriae]